jgi:hypothetical protein
MTRLLRALCCVSALAGLVPGPLTAAEPPPPMQRFVILFRQGPHPLTPADRAARQAAISAWAREHNAAGHKLEPRTLGADRAASGAAAPAGDAWPVSALLFLEAHDLAEATRVAASHPAKDYNVAIEVRPWSTPAAGGTTPTRISGRFEVKMTPVPAGEDASPAGRFTLDKRYLGDLAATARGEMLTGMTATRGSAGYVALEKVTGTLAGRRGSFLLQHSGLMNRGDGRLTITVVPDSATEELVGLSGTMSIRIAADGAHFYDFDYALPGPPQN